MLNAPFFSYRPPEALFLSIICVISGWKKCISTLFVVMKVKKKRKTFRLVFVSILVPEKQTLAAHIFVLIDGLSVF